MTTTNDRHLLMALLSDCRNQTATIKVNGIEFEVNVRLLQVEKDIRTQQDYVLLKGTI